MQLVRPQLHGCDPASDKVNDQPARLLQQLLLHTTLLTATSSKQAPEVPPSNAFAVHTKRSTHLLAAALRPRHCHTRQAGRQVQPCWQLPYSTAAKLIQGSKQSLGAQGAAAPTLLLLLLTVL